MRGKAVVKSIAKSGVLIALGLFIAIWSTDGREAVAAMQVGFPRPASIEPNVDFWVDAFTAYSIRDFVIHDTDQIWRVYDVMHVPGEGDPTRDQVDYANSYLKAKYADILTRLASGRQPVTDDERRVAELFRGEPLSAYAQAAQNLRVQQGLRERFRDGLLRSRRYWPTMERIFREAGLPPELVTLAEVESGFYYRARSSAGAVGIWQFTRSTGKEFMHVSRGRDDRLNPVRETEAAAKLLRANYEALGSWPLAITAYNYGTNGMERASAQCGGDYCRVLHEYNGAHFGFASKNYYAEFLAAMQVHEYEDKYFPGIEDEEAPPLPTLTEASYHPHARAHSRHSSAHHRSSTSHHRYHHSFQRHSA